VVGIGWALTGLSLVTAGLSLYFWRSALDLQGHVRAGASALAELLERQLADDAASLPTPEALLPGLGTVQAVVIDSAAAPAGQSLAELDLRVVTGATVVAIGRDGDNIAMPSGHHRLEAGDTVVVAGAPHAVAAAVAALGRRGPEA
jgi:CPA2 family monovalent cation:H+ antiporter-2